MRREGGKGGGRIKERRGEGGRWEGERGTGRGG